MNSILKLSRCQSFPQRNYSPGFADWQLHPQSLNVFELDHGGLSLGRAGWRGRKAKLPPQLKRYVKTKTQPWFIATVTTGYSCCCWQKNYIQPLQFEIRMKSIPSADFCVEVRWKTTHVSKKQLLHAVWESTAEPSHLEHTSAVLKLCGLSPARGMWAPVPALPSATLGTGGNTTPFYRLPT